MGKILIVLGPTGSGKSRSVKNLNPGETIVINVLKKDLPFRGSGASYQWDRNMFAMDKWEEVAPFITTISNDVPPVKTVIIDDKINTLLILN